MDQITKAILEEYINQNSLESLPTDKAFEHFSSYLITSNHTFESFTTDDIVTGGGSDCGLDCIVIIVNGTLVNEPEEIEALASINNYLDVIFIFIQASQSSSFETTKIGQIGYGIIDFFSEQPKLVQNNRIEQCRAIWSEILERSRLFLYGNPKCYVYYITTGKWVGDQNLASRRDDTRKDIEDLAIFRHTGFECHGAEYLQRLYRESQNATSAEVTFTHKNVIPDIPGVQQAFIGLLPATEFLKLIQNENQEILYGIFYANVRHWQEWNAVNKEIRDSLSMDDTSILFPLLNNGVTIVARRVRTTSNRFTIEDYQIVNGCQTSFVLHQCRDLLDDSTFIPIKLIETADDNITSLIIKATNRQTEVTEEQLIALSEFPKLLESYFPTFENPYKLYYERRSRQYNSKVEIEKVRIINNTMLVRAFASMFLDLPHQTTKNYKALLSKVGTNIYHKDHDLMPYYVSAFAHYRLEYLFRNQTLEPSLKPARYLILLAYRYLIQQARPPRMDSREIRRYCELIKLNVWDDDAYRVTFINAARHVKDVACGNLHRDNIRTEPFTEALITHLNNNI